MLYSDVIVMYMLSCVCLGRICMMYVIFNSDWNVVCYVWSEEVKWVYMKYLSLFIFGFGNWNEMISASFLMCGLMLGAKRKCV